MSGLVAVVESYVNDRATIKVAYAKRGRHIKDMRRRYFGNGQTL